MQLSINCSGEMFSGYEMIAKDHHKEGRKFFPPSKRGRGTAELLVSIS